MPLQIQHPKNETELNELFKTITNLYRYKFEKYPECDDIMQHILIQTHKAVRTWRQDGTAQFKTYLFFLIRQKIIILMQKYKDEQNKFRRSMVSFNHEIFDKDQGKTDLTNCLNAEIAQQQKNPLDELIIKETKEGLYKHFKEYVKNKTTHSQYKGNVTKELKMLYNFYVKQETAQEIADDIGLEVKRVQNTIDRYVNWIRINKPNIKRNHMKLSKVLQINKFRAHKIQLKQMNSYEPEKRIAKEIV